MRRLGWAALSVVAGGLAVLVGLPLLSPGTAVSVGPNVFVNRPGPIDANNSPTLVRNPLLARNLVVAHRVDRPEFSAVVQSSLDGGATWQVTPLPLPGGLDRPFAPDVAFGPDGTLFVSYVNLEGNGNVPANLWLARSKDGGRTLSDPVRVAGPLAFQARLAIDAQDRVHLTWMQAKEVGLLKLSDGPNPIVASHSTDGGLTFSDPVVVSDAQRERVGAASPAIDAEGRLVVLYQDYKDDRRDFEFLEGPPWDNPFALVFTRSDDGGRTFSPGVEVDAGLVPSRRFLVFLPEFPSIATGRDGALYAAWADGRNGDEDVFLRRSDDGGRTWRAAVRVNDNPVRDGTSQYLPRVGVSPFGRVDVVYLDRRNDRANDVMTDAYLATASDGGKTFESVRMSSQSFDSRVGPLIDPAIPVDFGSRLGLVSSEDSAIAAWTDTRFGSEDSGRQDISAAVAQFVPAPPSQARLWTMVALLVVSLAGLVGWVIVGRSPAGRRRPGSPGDPAAAPDGRERVGTPSS